jgi:hypothetical protein
LCAVLWDDLDMELERKKCEFERRLEEGCGDLVGRIEELQRILREGGEARRREWEELNCRLMTADEKRKFENDHIQRVLAQMTEAFVKTSHAASEDMKREFAESRAESRAQREALMRMLDRLPPSKGEERGS